jgi:tryptophan synthase alpha chain
MACSVMAHLVAYYPDREGSLKIARALNRGGAGFLEVQFPFSDPTADGAAIQEACSTALEKGFKVDHGFELVKQIKGFAEAPVFIMSYCNLVYARGVEKFLVQSKQAGAAGLIVPDLPFDTDEGFYGLAKSMGLEAMPVVPPTVSRERLESIAALGTTYLYVALRKGITGAFTEIGEQNMAFLHLAREMGFKVMAGFGISTRSQIEKLSPEVYAAIVGSAFVREIMTHLDDHGYEDAVYRKMSELSGL